MLTRQLLYQMSYDSIGAGSRNRTGLLQLGRLLGYLSLTRKHGAAKGLLPLRFIRGVAPFLLQHYQKGATLVSDFTFFSMTAILALNALGCKIRSRTEPHVFLGSARSLSFSHGITYRVGLRRVQQSSLLIS